MANEKRRWERMESSLFAVLRHKGMKDKLGRGIVVDVTLHGIGLETELEMDVGEVYELDVEIPFTLKAKVVRRIVPGQMKRYGLQFVSQGFIDKLLLKKLLKASRTTAKVE